MFTLFLIGLLWWAPEVSTCPNECSCTNDIIFCSRRSITYSELKVMIKDMPDKFSKVFLQRNKLTYLPTKYFKNFTNLDFLNVADNKMNILPRNLSTYLPKLSFIDLSQNNITSIVEADLKGFENIKVLYLEENHIRELKDRAFNRAENLTHLYLGKNEIINVSKTAFCGLKNLRYLSLADNNVKNIQTSAFQNLTLEYMDLSKNQISSLNNVIFQGTTVKRRLNLDSNPIHCDCNLHNLYNYLKKDNADVEISGSCASPPSMINEKINDVMKDNKLECDACSLNQCQNNANCTVVDNQNYTCDCQRGYKGNFCDQVDVCGNKPCRNNGTCHVLDGSQHKCNCTKEYNGKICENKIGLHEKKDSKSGWHNGYIALIVVLAIGILGIAYGIYKKNYHWQVKKLTKL